ncbi:protein MODIFYING WALL LIGNIN-1-like [Miscanthus floridulus]|uniref:protein MODIFYING WALL LIGNIN-1-like n=1 Tax=Miscanthus floridulus TaxID=154761 RepID=UPI00345A6E16
MERKVVAVCAVVGFLGVLSAALGFAAEATRVKVSDVQTSGTPGKCIYPRTPALALGLISAVSLMLAQSIINTVAGCICCKRHPVPSDTNWSVALISFIISWCTFIIAFLLLLTGAALNDQRGEENMYFGSFCYVVKPGVFSGGAVLAFASVALAIVYYVALSSSKGPPPTFATPQNHGIAMGQPVIPQQSSEPVFVHEDTYNRRQQVS